MYELSGTVAIQGCTDTSQYLVQADINEKYRTTTSIPDLDQDFIYIFPNPVGDVLNIEVTDALLNHQVSIVNSIGETIKSVDISSNKLKINVADLIPGNYYIYYKLNNVVTSTQINKQ